MMRWLILLAVGVSGYVAGASGQAHWIPKGIYQGTFVVDMDERLRRAYSAGLIDGIYLGPFWGADETKLRAFQDCIVGMNDRQLAAMLLKHLQDNPDIWHQGANIAMYQTILKACP